MTRNQAVERIYSSGGRIFSVEFIKRTTGETRVMICRLGVRSHLKGGAKAYEPSARDLIGVFDMQRNAYRSINVNGITRLKIDGEDWQYVESDYL